jgi:hypothetical protein
VTARRDQDGRDRREADQVIGEVAPQPLQGEQEVEATAARPPAR